jgi:hypothetical protein
MPNAAQRYALAPKSLPAHPSGDGSGHHQGAVRQVEDTGYAEDQREACRTERVERADGETVNQNLPGDHQSASGCWTENPT